jgi:phosphatidate cytidylyltransferase
MKFGNLGKRLLFVAWAIPPGWWAINSTLSMTPRSFAVIHPGQLVVVVLAFLSCYEYLRMLRPSYTRNGFWLSYLWLAFMFGCSLTNHPIPHNGGVYLLVLLVAFEAIIWGAPRRRRRWARASLLFCGSFFLYLSAEAVMHFYNPPFSLLFKTFPTPMLSQLGIALVILTVAMCDSVAYFTGCICGKHHFSSISPKKTIEGSIGGFVGAVVTCSVGWWFLAAPQYPRPLGIALGVLIGIFAQAGDLFVSLMKRYFQVKDSSDLIPGHGGILDRFGSLFFAAPAVTLFAALAAMLFQK